MWSFAPRTYAFSRSEKPQSATAIDAQLLKALFELFNTPLKLLDATFQLLEAI